jgi:hypothetical protein
MPLTKTKQQIRFIKNSILRIHYTNRIDQSLYTEKDLILPVQGFKPIESYFAVVDNSQIIIELNPEDVKSVFPSARRFYVANKDSFEVLPDE